MRRINSHFIIFAIFSFLIFNLCNSFSYANTPTNREFHRSAPSVTIKFTVDGQDSTGTQFPQGSVITMFIAEPSGQSISSIGIELIGNVKKYTGSFTHREEGFFFTWNTQEPLAGEDPVLIDTYLIRLTIDGEAVNYGNIDIVDTSMNPMLIIIVIIVIVAGGGGGAGVFVMKKKKSGSSDHVAFSKAEEGAKKRGKIYSGASQIGKSSGVLAEIKHGDRKPTSQPKTPSPISSPVISAPKLSSSSFSDMKFVDSGKKFETTMLLKREELKMDPETKMNFLHSKTDSLHQSVDLLKAIIKTLPQEINSCSACKTKINPNWAICPYCMIKEQDNELGLKQSMLAMQDGVKLCPDCKKLLKPNWVKCPYCLVEA